MLNRRTAVLWLFNILIFAAALGFALPGAFAAALLSAPPAPSHLSDGLYATFTTPRGTITAELFYTRAPLMCANFTGLAEGTLAPINGQPFYTGLTWYRVVPGFVIQSGSPGLKDTDNNARPVPHRFPDEFVPGLRHTAAGTLSMANAGPDTNSCEFFLTLSPTPRLNYLHSVFGSVIDGLEILPLIRQDDPVSIKILRVGSAAKAFRSDAAAFAALSAAARSSEIVTTATLPSPTAKTSAAAPGASTTPGPVIHFDDPDHLLPTTPARARNFNHKLSNFERTTGLRIAARFLAQSPPDTEGRKLNAHVRDLAEKLGVLQNGALVLYLADRDEWKLWIGDASASAFMGRAGTVKNFMQAGAFHTAKQTLLTAAQAEGTAAYDQQNSTLPATSPGAPRGANLDPPEQTASSARKQLRAPQQLKLITDSILDALITKLEPR